MNIIGYAITIFMVLPFAFVGAVCLIIAGLFADFANWIGK
jgi:hypothetical protein